MRTIELNEAEFHRLRRLLKMEPNPPYREIDRHFDGMDRVREQLLVLNGLEPTT